MNFEIDKNKFDIKGTLYEFIEIYDEIKNKFSHENNVNVKTFCKHIKENFRFYNEVKVKCPNNTCIYAEKLQEFKNKFSNFEDLKLICEKCDYEKTSCEHGSNGEGDVPCLREKGNSFLNLIFCNSIEDIINVLLKFTTISAPILALFVILFKFTPFGKNLNKLKQEKRKNGDKKKEENIKEYMKNYTAYMDSEMRTGFI
ncbi:hypothetical protein PVC01_000080800 [Plasmodium vivax]|uniref:VIR protein n=1 Tax=Plasmodium vivax TaxID=5855 RepID=A0A1G4ED44_PLAVI|nr:hypothetical protein PVC01_000080800 [Plasmodium vivax]